jgi:hypothetical protein
LLIYQDRAGQRWIVFLQVHNLKVVGSNPTPATNKTNNLERFALLANFAVAAPLPHAAH